MKKHIGGLLLAVALLPLSANAICINLHGIITSTTDSLSSAAQPGDTFTGFLRYNPLETTDLFSLEYDLTIQTINGPEFYQIEPVYTFTLSPFGFAGYARTWAGNAAVDATMNITSATPNFDNLHININFLYADDNNTITNMQGTGFGTVPDQSNSFVLLEAALVLLLTYQGILTLENK